MNHPISATFTKGQREEEWSYIPTFLKGKSTKTKSPVEVQSVVFDCYPKTDNELKKCIIICETHGIHVWDIDDVTQTVEVFSYPLEETITPTYARFRQKAPTVLFFVTSNNQLVTVTFHPTGPVASSFFSHNYSFFDVSEQNLFAFTPDGQLHIYNTDQNPPTLVHQLTTTKYLEHTKPLAISSAYFAYPTYDSPSSFTDPPQYAGAVATETITNTVSWIADGVKSVYGAPAPSQDSKDKMKEKERHEFVVVADHREINTKKSVKKIAHFSATTSKLRAIAFDPKGELLATSDDKGYLTHVFRIFPQGTVDHLYVLRRGTTPAEITSLAFSINSNALAISSTKTTHVFSLPPDPKGYITKDKENKESVWVNSITKLHANDDAVIANTYTPNTLLQCVNTLMIVYDILEEGEKLFEKGRVVLNFPCETSYLNNAIFALPTAIGEDDLYKNVDGRICCFDRKKVKRYSESLNKFAIGRVAIERQLELLEKTMSDWITATSNVFDVDYKPSENERQEDSKDEELDASQEGSDLPQNDSDSDQKQTTELVSSNTNISEVNEKEETQDINNPQDNVEEVVEYEDDDGNIVV
ncbi:BCAS3 WD40 domain-containing protein [Entamoeba marina]